MSIIYLEKNDGKKVWFVQLWFPMSLLSPICQHEKCSATRNRLTIEIHLLQTC